MVLGPEHDVLLLHIGSPILIAIPLPDKSDLVPLQLFLQLDNGPSEVLPVLGSGLHLVIEQVL